MYILKCIYTVRIINRTILAIRRYEQIQTQVLSNRTRQMDGIIIFSMRMLMLVDDYDEDKDRKQERERERERHRVIW